MSVFDRPKIGAFEIGATLVIKVMPNGGFVVRQKKPKADLGAYSTVSDMLDALRDALKFYETRECPTGALLHDLLFKDAHQ